MSQNSDLSPSSDFIKCEQFYFEDELKVPNYLT